MRKEIMLAAIILSFQNAYVFAQVQDTTLNRLIEKAIFVSPKLKVLEDKQGISKLKIPQVSNLSDPMLTLGLMNMPTNSFSFSQEPMTGKIVGLSQAVPFPGKLSAAGNVQSKDVDINQQEIDDHKNEIRKNVIQAYYDLRFTREALNIAYKSKSILEKIREVVKTKYTVSKASQQNIIQVEVELTKIKDKIENLKGEESAFLATLNSYLLKEQSEPIKTNKIPIPESRLYTTDQLKSVAKKNRPFLKGIELAREKSILMEDLAEYEFLPNFNFAVQYSQRDELSKTNTQLNDLVSIMVGINIPFNYGGKKSSKVEETQLMQRMYSDQYEAALQILDKNFGNLNSSLKALETREKLIREGLMPQAEQSLKASLASYQVAESDFINVLDAQNKLFEIETNLYKIRTNYYKQLTEIEFLTGQKF